MVESFKFDTNMQNKKKKKQNTDTDREGERSSRKFLKRKTTVITS